MNGSFFPKKAKVTELTHAGVAPLKVKSALVQDSNAPLRATLTTIYNHQGKMCNEELDGRKLFEALMHQIRKHQFYFMMDSVEDHMTSFFFARIGQKISDNHPP
jgi:hypothetical protein